MRKLYYILPLSVMLSCANEDMNTPGMDNTESTGVECSAPSLSLTGDEEDIPATTRTSLTYDADKFAMLFSWEENEKIIVYPSNEDGSGTFSLKSIDGLKAKFDGNGFKLAKDEQYYSISKANATGPTGFNADQRTNIKITYEGQRQKVNGNYDANATPNTPTDATSHLGKYDYMTATAIASAENAAHFSFKHLGLTIRLKIKGLPEGVSFTKLTIYDASENTFREMARTTNITNGYSANDQSYNPYLNTPDLTDSSPRYEITLGEQDENGVEQGITVPSNGVITVFMEVPPIDFTGKTMAFRLTPKSGQTYPKDISSANIKAGESVKPWYCLRDGVKFEAGTLHNLSMSSAQSTKYNINVKVIKDWNKGNVTSQTRSTGDPGNAVTLNKPKYLYAFFVNKGKLVSFAKAEGTDASSGIETSNWTDANNIFSYTGTWSTTDGSGTTGATSLTLDATSDPDSDHPRAYIIASSKQISTWKDASGTEVTFAYGTTNGTAESVIQGLSYNYTNQADLVNLYSTAYVDGSGFTGTLGDDVKDVRLYHVASKVDINWENEKTTTTNGISIPSPLSGSVSLNNIPTTNLSFFNPTTNSAGSTTVSGADITTGTAYNGRQVWYVPQISGGTYNVTIGDTTQDITFTPDATYTSWFRGLVTIK